MLVSIITDTHYCFKKSNKDYHNYFERFYNDIFFPTLQDRGIDTVIHMGDAFDNRKGVDYWGLEWAQRVVYDRFRELGITVYQICGNHDCSFKTTNKVNSIETVLKEYNNIIPVIDPTEFVLDDLETIMIPWICKDNEKRTFEMLANTTSKVVFGHLELNGFTLFPGQSQTHGMSIEKFQKFDRVFTGHYHTRSDDGKIFYLGNPYQLYWSDVNDKRGFHIFNTNTYENEFIENPYNMFEKIYYNDEDYKNFDYSLIEGKNVKVIVNQKTDESNYELFISEIIKRNIIDLKIVENLDVNDSLVNINELQCEDTLAVLNKYIEQAEFKLDKNTMMKIISDTYKEALEMELF